MQPLWGPGLSSQSCRDGKHRVPQWVVGNDNYGVTLFPLLWFSDSCILIGEKTYRALMTTPYVHLPSSS